MAQSLSHSKWLCKYHIVWECPNRKFMIIIRGIKCERCKNENNQIKAGCQKYKCKHYEPVFKIFVHAFNRFALAEFLYPSLKSAFNISHFI